MARRRKRKPLPTPRDVLSGAKVVGVADLVRLIHRVNPTDRGLPQPQQVERYAQKSRLQSLLLREHRSLVVVEPVAGRGDELVLLRLSSGGRDAGHAVVLQLDEDVRAWVRQQLALREHDRGEDAVQPEDRSAAAAPRPGGRGRGGHPAHDAGGALERGRAALEAYDFERARPLLERALAEDPGCVAAAVALVEFLVDHLAAWSEAVAIAGRLRAPAAEHPDVREPLARAAARLGDVRLALQLVQGFDEERTGPVLVLVARAHLRQHALEEARKTLVRLREIDPAHPALVRLGDELKRQRALARVPAEQALLRLVQDERWEDLVQEARALLERWPGSETARRLLAEGQGKIRERERDRLTGGLRLALEHGELGAAEQQAGRLRALGGVPDELARRLDKALEQRRVAKARTRARRCAERMREGGLGPDTLGEYTGQPEDVRALVRRELPWPELSWLETLAGGVRGGRAARTVDAVLQLGRAAHEHERGAHARALELLEPGWELVRALGPAQALEKRARAALRQDRRRALETLVGAVDAAIRARDVQCASGLLDAVDESSINPEDKSSWRTLRERVRLAAAGEAALTRAEHLAQGERWIELRSHLEAAGEALGSSLPRALAAFGDGLDLRVQGQFRVAVLERPNLGLVDWAPPWLAFDSGAIVLPGGDAFIAVRCVEGWLFVRTVTIADGRVARLLVVRLPLEFVPIDHQLLPQKLWCFGTKGQQLCVDLRDGKILEWHTPSGIARDGLDVSKAAMVPGTNWLWLRLEGHSPFSGHEERLVVTRLGDNRVHREVRCGFSFVVDGCGDEAVVMVLDLDAGCRLYHPRGASVSSFRAERRSTVEEALRLPDGGWLTLRRELWADSLPTHDEPDELAEDLIMELYDARGAVTGTQRLRGSSGERASKAVLAPVLGRVFVVSHKDQGLTLSAFSLPSGGRCTAAWEVTAPDSACLIHDALGERVVLIWPTASGPRWVALEAEQPHLPLQEQVPAKLGLSRVVSLYCGVGWENAVPETSRNEIDAIAALPTEAAEPRIAAFESSHGDDPDALAGLATAIKQGSDPWRSKGIAQRGAQRHPSHAVLASMYAHDLGWAKRWAEVGDVLDGVAIDLLPPRVVAHAHHLLGLHFLFVGHLDRARVELEAAAAVEDGRCSVDTALAYCDALEGKPPLQPRASSYLEMATFVHAVREADRHLAAGDHFAAIDALDHASLWDRSERQTAARRAWAWLQIEPRGLDQRVAKLLALAALSSRALGHESGLAFDLPVPPESWSDERVMDLAERARSWVRQADLRG